MTARGPLSLARLSRAERERLLERVAQLQEVDQMLRERGRMRPPDPPVPVGTPALSRDEAKKGPR